jgi:hypothetical protein
VEEFEKRETILEREGHHMSVLETGLTGMQNRSDRSSLTDNENKSKNRLSSPRE